MSNNKKRTISYDDYLKALGMWTLANMHQKESSKYDKALCKHLAVQWNSHVSDSVWDDAKSLDEALALEGINIAPEGE